MNKESKKPYRLVRGSHRVGGVQVQQEEVGGVSKSVVRGGESQTLKPGAIVYLTDLQYRSFRDRFEPVDPSEIDGGNGSGPEAAEAESGHLAADRVEAGTSGPGTESSPQDDPKAETSGADSASDTPPIDLDDHWTRITSAIEEIEDPAEIEAIIAAEEAGKNRASVMKAAGARLDELGGAS